MTRLKLAIRTPFEFAQSLCDDRPVDHGYAGWPATPAAALPPVGRFRRGPGLLAALGVLDQGLHQPRLDLQRQAAHDGFVDPQLAVELDQLAAIEAEVGQPIGALLVAADRDRPASAPATSRLTSTSPPHLATRFGIVAPKPPGSWAYLFGSRITMHS